MLNTFSRTCWSLYSLGKCVLRSSAQFLICFYFYFYFFLLFCMSFLYVLGNNPLLEVCFANIFSHIVDCLFILLFILLYRHFLVVTLVNFCFCYLCFGVISKKSLLLQMTRSFSPMNSSRSLAVQILFLSL